MVNNLVYCCKERKNYEECAKNPPGVVVNLLQILLKNRNFLNISGLSNFLELNFIKLIVETTCSKEFLMVT